jgi:hypothetical protein
VGEAQLDGRSLNRLQEITSQRGFVVRRVVTRRWA